MKVRDGRDVVKFWCYVTFQRRDENGTPLVDDNGEPVMATMRAAWIKDLDKAQALVKLCREMGIKSGYDYNFTGQRMTSRKQRNLALGVIRARMEVLVAAGQLKPVTDLP